MLGWSSQNSDRNNALVQAADLRNLVDISVPPNTLTEIPMDDVKFDNGNFSNADGKVHINEDGVYVISAALGYEPMAVIGSYRIEIYNGSKINMATTVTPMFPTTFNITVDRSYITKLQKGDVLSVHAFHSAKTAAKVWANSSLSIAKLK